MKATGIPPSASRSPAAPAGRLDLGCVAAHGMYRRDAQGCYSCAPGGQPAIAFLFELIVWLQGTATVPMIAIRAYAQWLA